MTNIVGGNTGNLSQSGAGKDNVVPGFAQNSTGLDFFELISFATKNQEFSTFDGKGNNLTIENSDDIFEEKNFYIMNIWASWCLPCREEHTFLMNLKTLNKIKVFGINYKDDLGNAKKFLKELGNPYDLILADKNGTISIEWGAYGVPETFLIYDKKIIKRFIGPINSNSLLEINNLLK